MSAVEHAKASRERLNFVQAQAAPHLRPIIAAVRDCDISMMFVPQIADPFRLPRKDAKPTIFMIGDDLERAEGPDTFHMPSIRRAIRACHDFTVVSGAPLPHIYASAAYTPAIDRRHSMLVETRPEQEIAWVSLIRKLAPGRPIILLSVKGGHA